jgi:hypothetical protein
VPGVSQAPASAPRREKARKHASQSAYRVPAAGSDRSEWFYGATGSVTILVLLLSAAGIQRAPGRQPAIALARTVSHDRYGSRR